jgi:hypothetical protein
MIYEITAPNGWFEPGWYIRGREYLGPCATKAEAEALL